MTRDTILTTHLYLVRHGATDANEQDPPVLQGDGIDLPLNANGRRQAVRTAELLSGLPIARVYSSPLLRALETARAIAAPHGLDVHTEADVREACIGEWEGLDWGTIERRYPRAHARFQDDPGTNSYLGGESYGDVLARAAPAVERLLQRHAGEAIALVAHNVVNRVLLSRLLGIELRRAKSIPQANGCVNLITWRARTTALVTLNSVFHVADVVTSLRDPRSVVH
jgi:broad specificity phosphatase PhoE